MKKCKIVFCAFTALVVFFLCGCPAEIQITPKSDGSFFVEFNTVFGKIFTSALEDLISASATLADDAASEKQTLAQVFPKEKIEEQLYSSGFYFARARLDEMVTGEYNFSASGNAKGDSGVAKLFQRQKIQNGKTTLELKISPELLRDALLKDESVLKAFADTLMAPLLTGEQMDKNEYRELLGDVYGARIADELLAGKFTIRVLAPSKVLTQTVAVEDLLCDNGEQRFVFEY